MRQVLNQLQQINVLQEERRAQLVADALSCRGLLHRCAVHGGDGEGLSLVAGAIGAICAVGSVGAVGTASVLWHVS